MWQFKSLVGLFYRSQKASISLIIVLFFPMMTAVIVGSYSIASDYNSHRQAEDSLAFLCNSAVNYHLSEGFINVEYFHDTEYIKDSDILEKIAANTNLENIEYDIYREGDKYVVSLKGYYDSFISRFIGSGNSPSGQKYYNRECVLQQQIKSETRLFQTDFEEVQPCLPTQYSHLTMTQGSYFQVNCGPPGWVISHALKVIYGYYGPAQNGKYYAELDILPNPNNRQLSLSRNIYLNAGEYKIRFLYKGRGPDRVSNTIALYLEDLTGNTGGAILRKLFTVNGTHSFYSWSRITMKFKVNFNGNYKLKFLAEGPADGFGGILDDIELFSVGVIPDLGIVLRDGTDTRNLQNPPATNENTATSEPPTTTTSKTTTNENTVSK